MINNHPRFPGMEVHRWHETMDPITFRTRQGHSRQIYLESDFDAYPENLPCGNIAPGRVHLGFERN